MEIDVFFKMVDRRIDLTKEVLASKSAEYASGGDKLHNFKRAAKVLDCSPEQALLGMWTKHLVSLIDLIKLADQSDDAALDKIERLLDEKIGDTVNYAILLEGLFRDRLANRPKP